MNKIRIAIAGASGRMGRTLIEAISQAAHTGKIGDGKIRHALWRPDQR